MHEAQLAVAREPALCCERMAGLSHFPGEFVWRG